MRCLRMPGDVRQRFLDDAEYRACLRLRHLQWRSGNGELAYDARSLREILDEPFDRRYEAEIVEHQRPQVGCDAPRSSDRAFQKRRHSLESCTKRRVVLRRLVLTPRDVHLQHRQRLPELVVQFPGYPALLLLARQVRGRAKLLQFFLRLAQCLDRFEPRRHVAQDHRIEPLTRSFDLRYRRIDWKLVAVTAQAGHDAKRATHPP